MIIKDKYWISIVPSKEYENDLIEGKWIYYGEIEYLHSLTKELNKLVINGKLPEVKISQKKSRFDIFEELPCGLICFTEKGNENKDQVKKVLEDCFGISMYIWKSEKQTFNDWSENGWLNLVDRLVTTYRKAQSKSLSEAKIRRTFNHLLNELDKKIDLINEPHRLADLKKSKIEIVISKIREYAITSCINEERDENNPLIHRIKELEQEIDRLSNVYLNPKTKKSFIKNILELISKDKIEEAIDRLLCKYESIDPFKHQEIILISGRYSNFRREKRIGLNPPESIANSIRFALTELINS